MSQTSESVPDFAARLLEDSGSNTWSVAIVASSNEETTANDIVEEANAIEPGFATTAMLARPTDFFAAVAGAPYRLVVAAGFECFDESAWSMLDVGRSRLMRDDGVTALVMTAATFGRLQAHAPNLASWIGGAVFELGESERPSSDARLEQLRAYGKMSDEELIAKAKQGTLEPDPYFAEWLVLLGRGELLGE